MSASSDHTWSDAPSKKILDMTSVVVAHIANELLAAPGCLHVELGGSAEFYGGDVRACIALVDAPVDGTNLLNWVWRATIFNGVGWSHMYFIHGHVAIDTNRPTFEQAIVPLSRAWNELVARAMAHSTHVEHERLALILAAYNESWNMDLPEDMRWIPIGDPLVAENIHNSIVTSYMKRVRAMRRLWEKTPEGILAIETNKGRRARARRKGKSS